MFLRRVLVFLFTGTRPLYKPACSAHTRRSLYSGQKEFHSFIMATSHEYTPASTFPTSSYCKNKKAIFFPNVNPTCCFISSSYRKKALICWIYPKFQHLHPNPHPIPPSSPVRRLQQWLMFQSVLP